MQIIKNDKVTFGYTDKCFTGKNFERELPMICQHKDGTPTQAVYLNQVHKDGIVSIDRRLKGNISCFEGDALITSQKNIMLVVQTADCFPVYIYDNSSVAIVHAGWRSASMGILRKTIKRFDNPENVKMVIGPGLEKKCFEVKKDFLSNKCFLQYVEQENEKIYFDLQQFLIDEASLIGVARASIQKIEVCTYCADYLYSFRAGDKENRIINYIVIN